MSGSVTVPATGSSAADRERQALVAIRALRGRLDEALQARSEPIAIVGLSCRFPGGVTDPASYWRLLSNATDAVRPIPPERMDVASIFDPRQDMPGKSYTRWAGLVDEVDTFDTEFFGISPREAAQTDPQQRLFLEGVWLALEHAGIAPTSLAGSNTAVFVGVTTSEYARLHDRAVAAEDVSAYSVQGLALNAVAGRVAHALGLQGPALAIDTACSSSLVAIDRACRSLRDEECQLAIAGGVNVLVTPEGLIAGSRWGMFAPDGRCKSFSAAADGFVRGEGCGVVVLKRLRDAIAGSDRILAVIRGSAVNHDGPSSGLTVPNGLAQQALIRQALKAAGVPPHEIGYVEAHGTGTALGDPIEAEALGAVVGTAHPSGRPLLIGSVKTNIGHLESAAGIAGLIKVVLGLNHGEVPGQLHWNEPSPHIRWDALNLQVVDRLQPWQPINGRRIAGVSSFGFSGTNAHLVVEAAPGPIADSMARARPPEADPASGVNRPFEQSDLEPGRFNLNLSGSGPRRPMEILPISARTESALRTLAQKYSDRLEQTSPGDWPDLCHTAAVGRGQFAHRLSVRGADAEAGRAALQAFLANQPHPALVKADPGSAGKPRVAYLFTGQGSQYPGMGQALYACSPGFRRIVERAEAALAGRLDVPLGAVMRGEHPDAAALLNQTLYTQPALYVLEYALAEFWRELGIQPFAVLGHSLGEYVGCAYAGVFGFEDGLSLVADRARLMHGLAADGAMLAVAAGEADVTPLLAGRESQVSLAGINASLQVIVSGERVAVEAIAAACAGRHWRTHMLPVSQAFHSPLMEPIAARFQARAAELAYAPPQVPVISNVTGAPLSAVNADYWCTHMREPVRFAQGLDAVQALGCDVLIEIGPKPVLIQLARQAAQAAGAGQPRRTYLTSLKGPGADEWDALSQAVQELYAAGADLDWAGWNRFYPRRKVDAPTYPFERRRYWITASAVRPATGAKNTAQPGIGRTPPAGATHPMLGTRLRSALEGGQFEAELTINGETAWLADHRIHGQAIMPATGLIEIMLAAGQAIDPHWRALEDLSILAPLRLPPNATRTIQTVVSAPQNGGASVRIFAAMADTQGIEAPQDDQGQVKFRLHAQARLTSVAADAATIGGLATAQTRCTHQTGREDHYRGLTRRGIDFGPTFRSVQQLWSGDHEAIAEIASPLPSIVPGRPHPATLDACLQSVVAALDDTGETFLPVALKRFELLSSDWPERMFGHARVVGRDPNSPDIDFTIYNAQGQPLARIDGQRFQNTSPSSTPDDVGSWLYDVRWHSCPATPSDPAGDVVLGGRWLLMADKSGVAMALARRIEAAGGTCVLAEPGSVYRQVTPAHIQLDPTVPEQFHRLLELAADPFQGVVHCWPIGLGFDIEQAPAAALAEQSAGYGAALHLIQALVQRASPPRLVLATAGAAPVHERSGAPAAGTPAHAMMSALRKTLQSEFPEVACRVIDLDAAMDPAAMATALAMELARSDEPEVTLRGTERFVPRIVPAAPDYRAADDSQLVELLPAPSGLIDELRYATRPRSAPKLDEVEIEVHATGLNFRDVLNALGMLPGTLQRLGGECAGVIARAGAGSSFTVGQPVLAFCPGQSGSFVTVPARNVARKPEGVDFAQAAGLPIAYLTAIYALDHLANLQSGETILIHTGAGGLGSAAIHLALHRGARVYATAGSEAKRNYVRALGVSLVMNSRSVDFADATLAETGGRGVDVVLNTLNGDFVPASFRALAPGGRFIEVGKRGVFTPQQAREHRADVAFHQMDLGEEAEADETLIPLLMQALTGLITQGAIPPLPVETVAYAEAPRAFRKMAEALHIGKLVLSHRTTGAAILGGQEGAWLITGGFGALGLQAASWLADRGVKTVILAGPRRRRPETVAALEKRGLTVIAAETDCADADALRALISGLPPGKTLRGVIHCAGTLLDATLPQQSWQSFASVAGPKLAGALALHQATAGLQLDAFILFSSASAVVGSAGQANYAAANAAMNVVAQARRARGQVGFSVEWGPWAEGMAAGERTRRRATGFKPITALTGFAALELLLASPTAQASVLPVDWDAFLAEHPRERLDPFFATVHPTPSAVTPDAAIDQPSLAHKLRTMAPLARRPALLDHLQQQVAKVLGSHAVPAIAPAIPLQERGLDSLMSVELRNLLLKSLDLKLPPTLALDYPTLDTLSDYLLSRLFPDAPVDGHTPGDSSLIAGLSDAEAEAMLRRELEDLNA